MIGEMNRQKSILLTGSSGMLGNDIYDVLCETYNLFCVDKVPNLNIPSSRQFIGDLTDHEFLCKVLSKVSPEVIVHCAAIVNLVFCEENRSITDALHIDVTKVLAGYKKAKIVFISSDSVFSGEKGEYLEEDLPDPVNYYGKSKFLGEKIVQMNSNHIILRTNIFGFTMPLKHSLAEWAIKKLLNGESIDGYRDVYFTTIYTKHFAQGLLCLLDREVTGTFHLASSNHMSKFSFLKYLEGRLTNKTGLVRSIDSLSTEMYPRRPINPTLRVDKISSHFLPPTIEEGVDLLVNNYRESNTPLLQGD